MLVLVVDTTRPCTCEAHFVAAQRCCSEPGLIQLRLSGSGQPLDGFLCISLLTSVAPDLTPSTHKAGRKQELAAHQWPLPHCQAGKLPNQLPPPTPPTHSRLALGHLLATQRHS